MAADWKVESAQKCTNQRILATSGCFDSVLFISNPNFKFLLTKLFLKTGFSFTEFQLFLTISLHYVPFFLFEKITIPGKWYYFVFEPTKRTSGPPFTNTGGSYTELSQLNR